MLERLRLNKPKYFKKTTLFAKPRRQCLSDGLFPNALTSFIHSNFKNRSQREIAYIICHCIFEKFLYYPRIIPRQHVLELGYNKNDFHETLNKLYELNLVVQTSEPSSYCQLSGEYKFNILGLMKVLRESTGLARGLRGAPQRVFTRVADPKLKDALKQTVFTWDCDMAFEYCLNLPVSKRFRALDNIKYLYNGKVSFNWGEDNQTGSLTTNRQPLATFMKKFWQSPIVGGGYPIFNLDFRACYPNLTNIYYHGKPFDEYPYERIMELVSEEIPGLTLGMVKEKVNTMLNNFGNIPYEPIESLEAYRRAMLDVFQIRREDFLFLGDVQVTAKKWCDEIIRRSIIKSVEKGLVHIIPISDCLRCVEDPDLVAKEMQEACIEVVKCRLPYKKEQMPVFSSKKITRSA